MARGTSRCGSRTSSHNAATIPYLRISLSSDCAVLTLSKCTLPARVLQTKPKRTAIPRMKHQNE